MGEVDPFEAAAQPTCPTCGVVMVDAPGKVVCRECGYTITIPAAEKPPEFDGPSVRGG